MHYARIEEKNICCNATPTRQDARGSSKINATVRARHCLPRRYRPHEVPAFLGDGRCEASDFPLDGACAAALSLRVGKREALPSRHNGTCDAALDVEGVGGDMER
ncbi:hypothetical protein HAX54_039104, partial [Datura stramonium]|nr:hypothetical protein [Datura stramonium]